MVDAFTDWRDGAPPPSAGAATYYYGVVGVVNLFCMRDVAADNSALQAERRARDGARRSGHRHPPNPCDQHANMTPTSFFGTTRRPADDGSAASVARPLSFFIVSRYLRVHAPQCTRRNAR
jgi:hypothetical protein